MQPLWAGIVLGKWMGGSCQAWVVCLIMIALSYSKKDLYVSGGLNYAMCPSQMIAGENYLETTRTLLPKY